MEKIKFREWGVEQKTFYYFNMNEVYKQFDNASEISQNNIIWQQFTGLTDKNNKEIFDGDIVEWVTTTSCDNGNRGVIAIREGCWGIEDHGFFKLYNQLHQIKVIGNIYQNPGLLK